MNDPLSDPREMAPLIFSEAEQQAMHEQSTIERIERIERREMQIHAAGSEANADKLWLAQIARTALAKMIEQRIALALAEQGQGILGDDLRWSAAIPPCGPCWVCEPGGKPKLARVRMCERDEEDSEDDGLTLETIGGTRYKLARYLRHNPLLFAPLKTPTAP